jgi:hypothetical protein
MIKEEHPVANPRSESSRPKESPSLTALSALAQTVAGLVLVPASPARRQRTRSPPSRSRMRWRPYGQLSGWWLWCTGWVY